MKIFDVATVEYRPEQFLKIGTNLREKVVNKTRLGLCFDF